MIALEVAACLAAWAAEARPIPPQVEPPCVGHDFDMMAGGVVETVAGAPVPGAPIARYARPGEVPEVLTRAGPDGLWDVTLPGPGAVFVPAVGRTPASICVAIPSEIHIELPPNARFRMHMNDLRLVADPVCAVQLDAPVGTRGALIARRPTGVVLVEAVEVGGPWEATLPCDADGVAIDAADGLLGGGCGRGFACVRDGAATLAPLGAPRVTLTTEPDALIETPWGPRRAGADGVAQIAGDGAPFQAQIEHPGHTPAIVTVDGPETAAPLRPAREVEVRCAGFVMDRCPFVPDLVVGEATLPCRWLPRFGVVCDVPVDTPARVGAAGVWQEIPAAPPGLGDPVELDYRVFTGGVTGRAPQQDGEPTACSVLAIREVGWVEAILDGWLDRPRVRAARRTCDPDGTFDLGPLSPGTWRVRVDLLPGPVVERTVVVGDARVPIDLGG